MEPLVNMLSAQLDANEAINESTVTTINMFYTPFLVLVGTVGNLFAVVVFLCTYLRRLSSSYYLSVMNISDTVFLVHVFVVWLRSASIWDIYDRPGFCEAFVYLSNLSSSLSAWCVVAFTFERFVAVMHPLQSRDICTVSRARSVLLWLIVCALVVNLPLLVIASSDPHCSIDPVYAVLAANFNTFDTIVSFVLPLTIIVVLNTFIVCAVWKVSDNRQKLSADGRPPLATSAHSKVTKMLLVVSTAFVTFNLPAYAMRIMVYMQSHHTNQMILIQHVCNNILFYSNFGINFIIYCLCGANFRNAVMGLFCRKRMRRNAINSVNAVHINRRRTVASSVGFTNSIGLTEMKEIKPKRPSLLSRSPYIDGKPLVLQTQPALPAQPSPSTADHIATIRITVGFTVGNDS